MPKYRTTTIAVDGTVTLTRWTDSPPRDWLQSVVGGYIEVLFRETDLVVYVNEDGLRLGLRTNVRASNMARVRVVGPVVAVEGPIE